MTRRRWPGSPVAGSGLSKNFGARLMLTQLGSGQSPADPAQMSGVVGGLILPMAPLWTPPLPIIPEEEPPPPPIPSPPTAGRMGPWVFGIIGPGTENNNYQCDNSNPGPVEITGNFNSGFTLTGRWNLADYLSNEGGGETSAKNLENWVEALNSGRFYIEVYTRQWPYWSVIGIYPDEYGLPYYNYGGVMRGAIVSSGGNNYTATLTNRVMTAPGVLETEGYLDIPKYWNRTPTPPEDPGYPESDIQGGPFEVVEGRLDCSGSATFELGEYSIGGGRTSYYLDYELKLNGVDVNLNEDFEPTDTNGDESDDVVAILINVVSETFGGAEAG